LSTLAGIDPPVAVWTAARSTSTHAWCPALFVLAKIDEIPAWEQSVEHERETKSVELGRYLYGHSRTLAEAGQKGTKAGGWTKALEFVKGARREGQRLDSATWLHNAQALPKEESFVAKFRPKRPRLRLDSDSFRRLCRRVPEPDGWCCQCCGSPGEFPVRHFRAQTQLGDDIEKNLTLLNKGMFRLRV
jgi:hypothetical protein